MHSTLSTLQVFKKKKKKAENLEMEQIFLGQKQPLFQGSQELQKLSPLVPQNRDKVISDQAALIPHPSHLMKLINSLFAIYFF